MPVATIQRPLRAPIAVIQKKQWKGCGGGGGFFYGFEVIFASVLLVETIIFASVRRRRPSSIPFVPVSLHRFRGPYPHTRARAGEGPFGAARACRRGVVAYIVSVHAVGLRDGADCTRVRRSDGAARVGRRGGTTPAWSLRCRSKMGARGGRVGGRGGPRPPWVGTDRGRTAAERTSRKAGIEWTDRKTYPSPPRWRYRQITAADGSPPPPPPAAAAAGPAAGDGRLGHAGPGGAGRGAGLGRRRCGRGGSLGGRRAAGGRQAPAQRFATPRIIGDCWW